MGVELSGKTLGVVGCGRIGQVFKSAQQLHIDMSDVIRIAEVMNALQSL